MKRRILLADDSVTIQKVIELTFMDEDYEVRAVSNGDDAVKLLSEIDPDLVIADVHMPGANGYEVCRRAKQLRAGLPVLLLVGTFEPFDEAQARAVGADSHLKKPFDSQELLQRVEELIAARGAAAPAAPAVPAPDPVADWTAPAASTPDWLAQPAAPDFGVAPPSAEPLAGTAKLPHFEAEPSWNQPAEPSWGQPAEPSFSQPAEPSRDQPAEPSWGNFELEPEPAPSPFAAPAAAAATPEPFDHEPSFALEPDPGFQVEAEPVFSLDEGEPTFGVREDVFGAPNELSLDEAPQDNYLAEEPAPAAAGFNWNPEPAPAHHDIPTAPWAVPAPPPQPQRSEPEPFAAAVPEPEPAFPPGPTLAAHEPAPAADQAAHEGNGNGRLSDDDVDRIARRVVELLGDRAVRDVAWEVIPDMAEVIIRDRLRELEAQVE